MPDEQAPPAFTPITSQDELNRVISDRLARERAKFSDYDALKAKADQLDARDKESKTALEQAADRITALEGRVAEANATSLRATVAARFGVSTAPGKDGQPSDADLFLTGGDEATLTAQAQRLAERNAANQKPPGFSPHAGKVPAEKDDQAEARDAVRRLFGGSD
jgi:hypothetical protein